MISKLKNKFIGVNMTKTSWVLAATLATTSLFAENNCNDCPVTYRPGEVICDELPEGPLYSSKYFLCGSDCMEFFVAGEFLYWQYKMQGSQEEQIGQFQQPVGNVTTNTALRVHTKYKPGFRITAGVNLTEYDDWSGQVVYTWFNGTDSANKSATGADFITPKNGITPQAHASNLHATNHTQINFLSGTMGRPSYFGQRLILNPYFGLKGFWQKMTEHQDFTVIGGLPGSIDIAGKVWGIGPYAGLDLKGLLCWGAYLTGHMGITEAYVRITENNKIVNFPSSAVNNFLFTYKGKNIETAEIYEGNIGLGWGTYFGRHRYHADFAFVWDFITIPDMVGPPSFGGVTEFYLQGLSVKAQLDF